MPQTGRENRTASREMAGLMPQSTPFRSIDVELHWAVSKHARRLGHLAIAALALAVVAGRPGLVAIALPALALLGARSSSRPKTVHIDLTPSARRIYEGEQVAVTVQVTGHGDKAAELALRLALGAEPVKGFDRARSSSAVLRYQVTQWGRARPGVVEVALWDRCRVFESRTFVRLPEVACYPLPSPHREAIALGRLANRAGDHTARSRGEGVEFTGVRQYVAGDRQRSINWAASTRRGRLQVNTFAAERPQDVVLLIDATSDVGELGSGPLDLAMRGAVGVARTYLAARDRVGVVIVGANTLWLPPNMGDRQLHRIMDAVLSSHAGWTAGHQIGGLPRQALPPGAAVVAFSPLLDTKFVEALRYLRERNFSVTVIDVLTSQHERRARHGERLAQRLWSLERQALRFSLGELGVTLVDWDGSSALSFPGRSVTTNKAGAAR